MQDRAGAGTALWRSCLAQQNLVCTQALVIYCHTKLSKRRKVLRAGWGQVSLSLWPGSKPEGTSNSTFWQWTLLELKSRAQPMLLITAGTGGSNGIHSSFRICPPTTTPRKGFLFSWKGLLPSLLGLRALTRKSSSSQELHGWNPKSQRYFQTPSITKIWRLSLSCHYDKVKHRLPSQYHHFFPENSNRTENPSISSCSKLLISAKAMEKNKKHYCFPLHISRT